MIIFTLHALERLKQRGISILEIQSIDEEEFRRTVYNTDETLSYIKKLKSTNLKIIYRIDEDKIVIITCFRVNK